MRNHPRLTTLDKMQVHLSMDPCTNQEAFSNPGCSASPATSTGNATPRQYSTDKPQRNISQTDQSRQRKVPNCRCRRTTPLPGGKDEKAVAKQFTHEIRMQVLYVTPKE